MLALALAVLCAYRVETHSLLALGSVELLGERVFCSRTNELLTCYAVRDAHAVSVVRYVVGDDSATVCTAIRSLVPCELHAGLHVGSVHVCERSRLVETYVSGEYGRCACACCGVGCDSIVVEASYRRVVVARESSSSLACSELLNDYAVACHNHLCDICKRLACNGLCRQCEAETSLQRCCRVGCEGQVLHGSRSVEVSVVDDREVLYVDIIHRLVADGVYAEEELLSGRGANLTVVCSACSRQLCSCEEGVGETCYVLLRAPLGLYLLGEIST